MINLVGREVWRPVKETDGLFEISSNGRVSSVNHFSRGVKTILKLNTNTRYLKVGLRNKEGKRSTKYVHTLVVDAFPEICGERFDGCSVDHINGIKTDNRAINLRVCTQKQNSNNKNTRANYKNRYHKEGEFERRSAGQKKRTDICKATYQYDLNGNLIKVWNSMKEAAEYYNVSKCSISGCCRGISKTSCGYIWKNF